MGKCSGFVFIGRRPFATLPIRSPFGKAGFVAQVILLKDVMSKKMGEIATLPICQQVSMPSV
jgi:hypothetical protein